VGSDLGKGAPDNPRFDRTSGLARFSKIEARHGHSLRTLGGYMFHRPGAFVISSLMALGSAGAIAQNITFSQADRTLSTNVNLAHQADINGDNHTDFLFDPKSGSGIYALTSDGHGDFASNTITTAYALPAVYAFGDFRRVGVNDLLVGSSSYTATSFASYVNNGKGVFTLGKKFTGLALGAVVADFNGDGKLDAVTLNNADSTHPTQTINLYYGNGGGSLAGPYLIAKPAGEVEVDQGTYDYYEGINLLSGDFDGDKCTDVAWEEFNYNSNSGNGLPPTSVIKIAYGNCKGGFTVKTVFSAKAFLNNIVVADLNRDGISDIVGSYAAATGVNDPPGGLQIFYGQKARTLSTRFIEDPYAALPKVGDFNGDGLLDIAYLTSDGNFPYGQDVDELKILLGNDAQSFSIATTYPLPHLNPKTVLVGDFNRDGKTDLALLYSSYAEQQDNVFTILTNTTQSSGGGCSAPSSAGVHVCSPSSNATLSSPVSVVAASTITGTLARMEVWVDGVKKYSETTTETLSTSLGLAAGTHRFAIFAVNTAGTKWETVVNATVK
jgi:hypothetical protein